MDCRDCKEELKKSNTTINSLNNNLCKFCFRKRVNEGKRKKWLSLN